MFKLFQNYVTNHLYQLPNVYTVSVRWSTKPRWLPIAKTKKFLIPQRPVIPHDELVELRRLTNIYSTQLKCVIQEIKNNYRASATAEEVILKREKDFQDAWEECMRINDEWNTKIAVEREERDKLELEARIEAAKERMKIEDAKQVEMQENTDRMIREQQELSKTFITEKNIDAHIQKILNEEPHSFNYAIDVQGRIYEGLNKYPSPGKSLLIDNTVAEKSAEESSSNQVNTQS